MLFPALKITFRAERRYEMAYVTVPKDLTKIKSKVMFNLTKRQLICFSAAVAIGLPLFFLVKGSVGTSAAALCMVLAMLPMFLLAMYQNFPSYTSDAADHLPCVDLGGRRIIKKKRAM